MFSLQSVLGGLGGDVRQEFESEGVLSGSENDGKTQSHVCTCESGPSAIRGGLSSGHATETFPGTQAGG